MQLFKSEHKKKITFANSLGSTNLPKLVRSPTESTCFSVRTPLVIGVSITPGSTALTNISWLDKSKATDLTKPLSADFETEYESLFGRIASCQIDETIQILAPGRTLFLTNNEERVDATNFTLVFKTSSKSPALKSIIESFRFEPCAQTTASNWGNELNDVASATLSPTATMLFGSFALDDREVRHTSNEFFSNSSATALPIAPNPPNIRHLLEVTNLLRFG